jgi:hypothetical protein
MKRTSISLLAVFLIIITAACNSGDREMFFNGKEAKLEKAIEADDHAAVIAAIKEGADPNAVGLHGVTPIIVTSGNLKFNAMKALVENGADPNVYDDNGDNAVTLAATTYNNDRKYLEYLLDHGGDPNSTLPDGDPLFTRIALLHDLDAMRYLIEKGADVDAVSRTERPLVFYHAGSADWDTAWLLIEHGAKFEYDDPRLNWGEELSDPLEHSPGSPLFEYKEKVWRFLCEHGFEVPPLTTNEMWEYLYDDDLPDPNMPIITCNHEKNKVEGEWGDLKPEVESALDYLKRTGRY